MFYALGAAERLLPDCVHPGWKADSFSQPFYLKYVERDAALSRPERQLIQQQLENPLAQKILSGGFSPGDTITVDVQDGAFAFA